MSTFSEIMKMLEPAKPVSGAKRYSEEYHRIKLPAVRGEELSPADSAQAQRMGIIKEEKGTKKPDPMKSYAEAALHYAEKLGDAKKKIGVLVGTEVSSAVKAEQDPEGIRETLSAGDVDADSPIMRGLVETYSTYLDSAAMVDRFKEMGFKNPGEGFKFMDRMEKSLGQHSRNVKTMGRAKAESLFRRTHGGFSAKQIINMIHKPAEPEVRIREEDIEYQAPPWYKRGAGRIF